MYSEYTVVCRKFSDYLLAAAVYSCSVLFCFIYSDKPRCFSKPLTNCLVGGIFFKMDFHVVDNCLQNTERSVFSLYLYYFTSLFIFYSSDLLLSISIVYWKTQGNVFLFPLWKTEGNVVFFCFHYGKLLTLFEAQRSQPDVKINS